MVKPTGARSNSWQDVADISATFGIALDGWQELILEAAMGERTDRTWAAKRVGISVPRQNGKSQLLISRALAGALLFGEKKIVVSAHQQDTARESFAKLMEIVEDDANASLRSRVKSVMNALNRESVKFANGATIQFKARSGAAGKGFSSDCLLLDEAQILGSRAWTSINSTMSAMRNPQVWLLGTPPQEEDESYTFEMVRSAAIDGKSTAAAWCEWSADKGAPDYDPATEFTRWSANPAWNTRINPEVVQGEYETYSVDRFAQDRLGIWSTVDADAVSPFAESWSNEPASGPADGTRPTALAIDKWHDGATAICGVWRDGEGRYYGELLKSLTHDNAAVVNWVVERAGKKTPVAIAGDGEAAAMIGDLRARGVPVNVLSVADQGKASVGILADVDAGSLTHGGGSLLNDAIAATRKAPIGKTGLWRIGRDSPESNVTPAAALAWARFAASVTKIRQRSGQSVFR